MKSRVIAAQVCLILGCLASAPASAQDPAKTLPDNYTVTFENDWVRVLRVSVPAGAKLPSHEHPAALIAYLYLTDSDPILFKHSGSNGPITRPAVKARSYRLSTGIVGETHAIENNSTTDSIYLRIEYKTEGSQTAQTRGRRATAPPLKNENAVDVDFTNTAMRITRVTIGAGKAMDVTTPNNEPALLIVTSDVSGKERWMDAGSQMTITNPSGQAIEYMRFDFLTRPTQ